jgi:hypothetical protein
VGKRKDLGVKEGDIYAGPLSDGRFGAVRVIQFVKDGMRPGRDSVVLACTCYLGETPPHADDPALRRVLRNKRFLYKNKPVVMITDQPPPSDFLLVGNFPPTEEERSIEVRGTYGSHWYVVQDVFMEWRWENDREAFVREVESERAKPPARRDPGPRRPVPGSSMTEDQFWSLIAAIDPDRGDAKPTVEPLISNLSRLEGENICEFAEILAEKLYRLDEERFAAHAGDAGGSDDGFLYARCYVVAKGKEYYDKVSQKPKEFPKDCELEWLLSAASEAYFLKTGDDLDHTTHYSFETGSNPAGWS